MSNRPLEGKVAIITGAGRGLGRAYALQLAQLGGRGVVNDLGGGADGTGTADSTPAQQVVNEIRAAGGEAVANYDDIATMAGAQSVLHQALETYGKLDILINNAGILRDRMSFNMEEEDWDTVIRVHLKGHFAPTRYAAAYWRDRAKATGQPVDATLIFTSSESGLYANPGQWNYAVAKAGIAAMAPLFARELGKYGVRSFAIAPRALTRLTQGILRSEPGPMIGPENVAPFVAYLCTDAAREWNGQVFVVGGGVVQLMKGWEVAEEIRQPDRLWTLDDLEKAAPALFARHPKQVGPFRV